MANGDSQVILEAPSSSLPAAPYANPELHRQQPFCGDREGWGPISPFRFDFTPCFLDVWVAFVAVWGVFMGVGALWFLLRKRIPQPVQKNWHFYTKLVRFLLNERSHQG